MSSGKPNLPKSGQNVVLRCLEEGDLDELFNLESDAEVKRYMGGPVSKSREEWVGGWSPRKLAGCPTFAVLAKDTLRFIGRASVTKYSLDAEDREIQVALAKEYQRRHFGREVCEILIRSAFDELSAEEVVGIAHPENEGSLKLLQRFGFKQTGIVCERTWQKGHLIFKLSRNDWQNH